MILSPNPANLIFSEPQYVNLSRWQKSEVKIYPNRYIQKYIILPFNKYCKKRNNNYIKSKGSDGKENKYKSKFVLK